MENKATLNESETVGSAELSGFELPDFASAQIRAFYDLWKGRQDAGLADAAAFDVSALGKDFPLLVRVARNQKDKSLFWRDVSPNRRWPFSAPVLNRPVSDLQPKAIQTRVLLTFNKVLETGMPECAEITSWMGYGQTVSLVRLVVPVEGSADRELLALWDVVKPD
ncbi:hypothetical protein [Hoeflea sp.]|uniref:hypothetical protein n=1 Tax=Hoeflea sp. TaxID=1940281 RepID=UPI00374929F3